jgi:hypothetical protein
MAVTAQVTQLGRLRLLATRGKAIDGEVVSIQPAPRPAASIRVLVGAQHLEVVEQCDGFPCEVGSRVRVTFLPDDLAVREVGDIEGKLGDAELFTFVIAPLLLFVGGAYSLWSLSKASADGYFRRYWGTLLRYLPILASLGGALSTVVTLVGGAKPARFELLATLFTVGGSLYYFRGLRSASRAGYGRWIGVIALYGVGIALTIVDYTS